MLPSPARPAISALPRSPARYRPRPMPDPLSEFRATLVRPERLERVRHALAQRLGSLVVVCEAVRRRHNMSAILRTCEAFGVHEVHLVTEQFRASQGAARGAERWVHTRAFGTAQESLDNLRDRGFDVYVADLGEGAFSPATVPIDRPLAIVFGSEVQGISDYARSVATGVIRVPMVGLTESLNVSVSAAIVVQRVAERRRDRAGADLDPAEQQRFVQAWLASEEQAAIGLEARTATE